MPGPFRILRGERVSNASKILSVAKGEVGEHEKRSGGHWVNDSKFTRWFGKIPGYDQGGYGYPWCAVFVAWCADKAGIASLYPKTAGCSTAVAWYKRAGRFSEYPAIGAQVFFGSGGASHTGIVHDYDGTYVYTYEGNTNTSGSAEGDGVYAKKRLRRDSYVYGYGYPKFSEGIKSADPKWAHEAPAKAPAAPAKPSAPTKPSVSLKHINEARAKDIPAATGHTTHKAEVLIVERALHAEGLISAHWVDGSFGTITQTAFDNFRRRVLKLHGSDATGSVGKMSLTELGKRHGFTVKA